VSALQRGLDQLRGPLARQPARSGSTVTSCARIEGLQALAAGRWRRGDAVATVTEFSARVREILASILQIDARSAVDRRTAGEFGSP